MKKNLKVTVNGVEYDVVVEEQDSEFSENNEIKFSQPTIKSISEVPAKNNSESQDSKTGSEKVTAPMPGTILSVNVSVGQKVKKGEVLIILEAMKMENEILSPVDGEVVSINVSTGKVVDSGAILVSLN